jgi:hypothetical protein
MAHPYTRSTRAAAMVAVLVLTALISIVRSPAASASPYEVTGCPSYTHDALCMYYDPSLRGANIGVNANVPDFAKPATYFPRDCSSWQNPSPNDCAGQGKPFWNDVNSVYNSDSSFSAVIWYDPNYAGPNISVSSAAAAPYNQVELCSSGSPLCNNNRAVSWIG